MAVPIGEKYAARTVYTYREVIATTKLGERKWA
jgi:hypothetical protein